MASQYARVFKLTLSIIYYLNFPASKAQLTCTGLANVLEPKRAGVIVPFSIRFQYGTVFTFYTVIPGCILAYSIRASIVRITRCPILVPDWCSKGRK